MSDPGNRTDPFPALPRAARVSPLRRAIGVALGAVVAVAAVLFVLGAWNPWELVVLRYRFGNPPLGLLLVPLGGLVALWLAAPVRNEAEQGRRIGVMLSLAAVALVGLLGTGIFGNHFRFDTEVLARSDDGTRAVVMVTDRDRPPESYVRIWDGGGLAAREVGELGRVCWARAAGSARFLTRDQVELDTPFGVWRFDLDPATGVPRQVLGPRCPDGPVPATLGTAHTRND